LLELKRVGRPLVLALNMIDIAQRRGIEFDLAALGSVTAPCTPWHPTRKSRSGSRPLTFAKSFVTGYIPQ